MTHFESPQRAAKPDALDLARQRQCLLGSAAEVLEKILPGDPLGLRALLRARLRERALFLDFDHLTLLVFAQVARMASDWKGRGCLQAWLLEQVDSALDLSLAEPRCESTQWNSDSSTPQISGTITQLAAPLGLDPGEMSAACSRFHGLDASVREAFFLLVMEGCSLDHASQLGAPSALQLARRARLALDVLRGTEEAHFAQELFVGPAR